MTDDIVARLRGTGGAAMHSTLDRVDAADEIERLRAELAAATARLENALNEGAKRRAERDALRALLREAREYTGYAAFYGDRIEADHAVDLCARIDTALNEGGGDE